MKSKNILTKSKRNICSGSVISKLAESFLIIIFALGCDFQPGVKTYIILLYDVSGSTRSVREVYLTQTLKIFEHVPDNSEIFINRITDASIQSSNWRAFEYTRELNSFLDYVDYVIKFNKNHEKIKKKAFVDSVLREIKNIVLQDSYGKTDIMSALYISGEFLEGRSGFKHLFIFTDALENAKIFDKRGMKINLKDVNVYFIGPGRNEARRFFELRDFWTSFIEESGGKVKNFGPELFLNPKELFKSTQK